MQIDLIEALENDIERCKKRLQKQLSKIYLIFIIGSLEVKYYE